MTATSFADPTGLGATEYSTEQGGNIHSRYTWNMQLLPHHLIFARLLRHARNSDKVENISRPFPTGNSCYYMPYQKGGKWGMQIGSPRSLKKNAIHFFSS